MEDFYPVLPYLTAASVAGILTLFDLDRHFLVLRSVRRLSEFNFWWWGFVLVNGILAALLYGLFAKQPPLDALNPLIGGFVIGLAYLALVRIKFTTLSKNGQDVPVGLEPLYEGAKSYFYKRINQIVRAAINEESDAMSKDEKMTLEKLQELAENNVRNSKLRPKAEQEELRDWIASVVKDKVPEKRKRLILISFILNDSRPWI